MGPIASKTLHLSVVHAVIQKRLQLANGYCDEPVTVVASLFTHGKAVRQFNSHEK